MGLLLDALLDALLRCLSPLSPAQHRTGFTQHLHDVGTTTHDGLLCGTLPFACCCVPYKLHVHSRGRCITSSGKAVIEGSFERQHISAAAIKPPHLSLALTHAFGTFLDYADTQQFGSEMQAEVAAKISSQFPPILPPWAMTPTITSVPVPRVLPVSKRPVSLPNPMTHEAYKANTSDTCHLSELPSTTHLLHALTSAYHPSRPI